MSRRRLCSFVIAAVMVAGSVAGNAGANPSVSITSVNGSAPPAGGVTVSGSTVSVGGTSTTAPAFLVDAGDSVVVGRGASVALTGFSAGATGAVSYAWTAPTGTFADAGDATTTYTAGATAPLGATVLTLAATDAATNTTVTDTVVVHVFDPTVPVEAVRRTGSMPVAVPDEIVDGQARVDGESVDVPFFVPAGSDDLVLKLVFGSREAEVSDLDLRVTGPGGLYADRTDGATGTPTCHDDVDGHCVKATETIAIADPVPGDYVARIEGYLSSGESYTFTATYAGVPAKVLPVLSTTGPFTFRSNESQVVQASVVPGVAATTSIRWDLNNDGRFETPGASARTYFGLGSHLVTAKVTDGRGYEHRETTAVRVVPAGSTTATTPFVVIAVNDSGVNPYHEEFSAATYPDARVLAATDNFTKHPSTYLPNYPANSRRIDLTLGAGYLPPADVPIWTQANIPEGQLVWFPGTKIVGAIDAGDSSAANSVADTRPIIDEDGHGTHSASVALGNTTGFCPSCLLMFSESFQSALPYESTWVDFVSNSWSYNPAFDILSTALADPEVSKASVERGQTVLFAAANGNEGNFLTPNNTYLQATGGPDWIVRVGAANSVTGKPILGDGNPVDVTSYGDGPIPAAAHDSATALANHSGTSSATPYTAGVMGSVLTAMREELGDGAAGQRPGALLAQGAAKGTAALADGKLTRLELWEAVMKTAYHDGTEANQVGFATVPANPFQYVFEGYGLVNATTVRAAVDVLLGRQPLPLRDAEDEFLASDSGLRRALFGEWSGAKPSVRKSNGKPTRWAPRSEPRRYALTDPAELTDSVLITKALADAGDPFDPPVANGAADANLTTLSVTAPTSGTTVDPRRQSAIPVTGRVSPGSASQRLYLRRTACGTGEILSLQPTDDTAAAPDADCTNLAHSATTSSLFYDFISDTFPMLPGLGAFKLNKDRPIKVKLFVDSIAPNSAIVLDARLSNGATIVGEQRLTKTMIPALTVTTFDFSFLPRITDERPLDNLSLTITVQRSDFPITTYLSGPSSYLDLPLAPISRGTVEVAADDPTFGPGTLSTPVSTDNTWGVNLPTAGLAPGAHTIHVRRNLGGGNYSSPVVMNVTVGDGSASFTGIEVGAALGTGTPVAWSAVPGGTSPWAGTVVVPGGAGSTNNVRARLVVDGVIQAVSAPVTVKRS